MRVKGITAAAIAALALAGCAQPNEEKVEADQILSDLLTVQSSLVGGQEGLTDRLEGRWNVVGLSRYIKKDLMPLLNGLKGLSAGNVNPGSDEAAGEVFGASNSLRKAAEQVQAMLDGFYSTNTAPELVDGTAASSKIPATPLGPIREDVESIESKTLRLEEMLLRSADASSRALAAIKAGLDATGNLDDEASERIEESASLAGRLERDAGLAARAFGAELEGYLSNMLETIEQAQAARLPDGACAQQPVSYPSTLGKPSVYVYVSGGVTCEFGSQLALDLFALPEFRDTGQGTWTPPETGPLPEWAETGFSCELGPLSQVGDPRVILCFAEDQPNIWTGPRVSFQAPSTAG